MPNFDGMHEVRLHYTTTVGTVVLPHTMTFDVRLEENYEPGTPVSDMVVVNWNGSADGLEAFLLVHIALIEAFFHTSTDFLYYDLWRYPEDGEDAIFIAVIPVSLAGTSSSPTVSAQQTILTWRTLGGGIMKLYLMETIFTAQTKQSYPTGNAGVDDVFEAVSLISNPYQGRDDTRPIAPLNFSLGQSEALWRKRNRP